ncbi:response regulator transcription factor [Sphingomonas sp. Leaf37]|uniref:response regulator transcription factor n=1 Tax=Sphingomonas sp. Leaf37 TaxID=2876552 RepID=UPI001E408CBA|nr:response regulator [Sphingomonas sp. Leaf37]
MSNTLRFAVIEDDQATSDLFTRWLRELETADQKIDVVQALTRHDAEQLLRSDRFDLICLDIQLGHERNAGVGLINTVHKGNHGPVLVISGAPADTYRSIMRELEAWDYLVKPLSEENKDSFLEFVSRALRHRQATAELTPEPTAKKAGGLEVDPLNKTSATYGGKRINLPLTGQRIAKLLFDRSGQLVPYSELYGMIATGHNTVNIRAHIQVIRNAIREVDSSFDAIKSVPMAGYMWKS